MTEKNIFVLKFFCHYTFQILVYFLCKNCNPPRKGHPLFHTNLPLKIKVLSNPLFFKTLVGGSTPPPPPPKFRLVQDAKAGKEMPESSGSEFLEKFLVNNFTLSDAGDNTSRLLNSESIADLPLLGILLAIHQKSREPSFWEVMDALILFAFANLTTSRNLLQLLFEIYFRSRFILLTETKKVISMNNATSTSSSKPSR